MSREPAHLEVARTLARARELERQGGYSEAAAYRQQAWLARGRMKAAARAVGRARRNPVTIVHARSSGAGKYRVKKGQRAVPFTFKSQRAAAAWVRKHSHGPLAKSDPLKVARVKRNPLLQIVAPLTQGLAMGAGAAIGGRAMRAWNPGRHCASPFCTRKVTKGRFCARCKAAIKKRGMSQSAYYDWTHRKKNPSGLRVAPATTALGRRVGYRVLDARGQQVYYTFRTKKAAAAAARRAAKRNPTRRRLHRLADKAMARSKRLGGKWSISGARAMLKAGRLSARAGRPRGVKRKRSGRLQDRRIAAAAMAMTERRVSGRKRKNAGCCNPKRDRRGRFVKGRKNPLTRKETAQVLRRTRRGEKTASVARGRDRPFLYGLAAGRYEIAMDYGHVGSKTRSRGHLGKLFARGTTRRDGRIGPLVVAPRGLRGKRNPLTRKERASILRMARVDLKDAKHLSGAMRGYAVGSAETADYISRAFAKGKKPRWADLGDSPAFRRGRKLMANPPAATRSRARPGQKILGSKIIPWSQARKVAGFDAAMKGYRSFHKAAPAHATIVRIADGSKKVTRRCVFAVGQAPSIEYQTLPGQKSNKAGRGRRKITWHHRMGEHGGRKPLLVHDPKSGVTSFVGGTYRVGGGWFRK